MNGVPSLSVQWHTSENSTGLPLSSNPALNGRRADATLVRWHYVTSDKAGVPTNTPMLALAPRPALAVVVVWERGHQVTSVLADLTWRRGGSGQGWAELGGGGNGHAGLGMGRGLG